MTHSGFRRGHRRDQMWLRKVLRGGAPSGDWDHLYQRRQSRQRTLTYFVREGIIVWLTSCLTS